MSRFRNDFGEDRVTPTLGYGLVADGATFVVPDGEWAHWKAGGFTPLDPEPTPPAPAPEPEPEPEAEPAPAAKAAAKTTATKPEGTEVA